MLSKILKRQFYSKHATSCYIVLIRIQKQLQAVKLILSNAFCHSFHYSKINCINFFYYLTQMQRNPLASERQSLLLKLHTKLFLYDLLMPIVKNKTLWKQFFCYIKWQEPLARKTYLDIVNCFPGTEEFYEKLNLFAKFEDIRNHGGICESDFQIQIQIQFQIKPVSKSFYLWFPDTDI